MSDKIVAIFDTLIPSASQQQASRRGVRLLTCNAINAIGCLHQSLAGSNFQAPGNQPVWSFHPRQKRQTFVLHMSRATSIPASVFSTYHPFDSWFTLAIILALLPVCVLPHGVGTHTLARFHLSLFAPPPCTSRTIFVSERHGTHGHKAQSILKLPLDE